MEYEDPTQHRRRYSDQGRRYQDHWSDGENDDLIRSGLPLTAVDPPHHAIRHRDHRSLHSKHHDGRVSNAHSSREPRGVVQNLRGPETTHRGRKDHRKHPPPKKRSQSESAMEKAIGTAAAAVFRIRNDPGSWVGEKGLKVAAATMAVASMGILMDVDKKKHPLAHVSVKMVEKVNKPGLVSSGDDSCITVAVKTAVEKIDLTSEDEEEPFKSALTLKFNTVRTYGNAITRLWAEQRTRRINGQMLNPSPHPRGFANKAIYRYLLRQTHEKGREEWADRMVGTIKDAYSPAKIPEHTRCAWGLKEKACGLRASVDFLFGNHMLLRSSNRRPIELADCFCLECPNEGVQVHNNPTYAFVVVMNQGKTNQNGRIEYGACLRHRDPYACLANSL
ncbi:hypothetical protein EDB81DRAFT_769175 [Dactylonectria macrodidyma]|uniref:Ndc10 domain-containing protein n=1 Tax=Dactylonectria macrodidyma TaxID=307937 RepID=A0A9P9CYT6_9HYPO|nr:hypothetical protein EDB81DRAFT_769175 [Dactylonectria macrodidyma]